MSYYIRFYHSLHKIERNQKRKKKNFFFQTELSHRWQISQWHDFLLFNADDKYFFFFYFGEKHHFESRICFSKKQARLYLLEYFDSICNFEYWKYRLSKKKKKTKEIWIYKKRFDRIWWLWFFMFVILKY